MTTATRPQEKRYPLSASVRAGIGAGIVVVGALTGLIAYAIAAKDCDYTAVNACIAAATTDLAKFECKTATCTSSSPWFWGVAGTLLGIVGAAVLSVLLARSFGEWQMQRGADEAGAARLRAAATSDRDVPAEGTDASTGSTGSTGTD